MRRTGLGVLLAVVFLVSQAYGTTFVVDGTVDTPDVNPGDGVCADADGVCSLRAATMEANELEGADVIKVPAGYYSLTIEGNTVDDPFDVTPEEGDLEILDDVLLEGAGAGATVIDASQIADRVISVVTEYYSQVSITVTIKGITLTGGSASYSGGCLYVYGATTTTVEDSIVTGCDAPRETGGGIAYFGSGRVKRLILIDTTVSDNHASWGGGVSTNAADLELIRTTVARNTVTGPIEGSPQWGGGVMFGLGSLTAVDSAIVDNVAGRAGGGIYAGLARLYLERTAVARNRALFLFPQDAPWDGRGGGIWVERTWLTMVNSTVSNNEAAVQGGGIYSQREGTFQIAFSTIAGNRSLTSLSGAGMCMDSPSNRPDPQVQAFRGTIIADNFSDGILSNCLFDEPVDTRGFNVDSDGTCGFGDATDLSGFDPGLAPLAANGGTGPTHALLEGSPAVDLVPVDECVFAIDNDLDGLFDEDGAGDGDEDGDWREDEDPPEPAVVDQRGIARPGGQACDAGAFEVAGEQTTEELINELIDDVGKLIDDGEINYGRGRSLIAELQVALWFLEFNNGEKIAIIRIELFIKKVERLMASGDLEPELGDELLVKARAVLAMLQQS